MKTADPQDMMGKSIVFYGAATQGSTSTRMSITPISIEIGKGTPP